MNAVTLNRTRGEVGRILKAFRERTGRQQKAVAVEAGISTSMLSQIERGGVSPSIDTLWGVCNALGLEMSELFSRLSPRKAVSVHRPGERLKTRRQGVGYEQLVATRGGTHSAELFLLELEPGHQAGLNGQGHEGAEMGYVLAGNATLTIDGVEYELKTGDSLSYASNRPHRLVNHGRETFRAVWCAMPPHKDYLDQNET